MDYVRKEGGEYLSIQPFFSWPTDTIETTVAEGRQAAIATEKEKERARGD
jgi:hypothetical protein